MQHGRAADPRHQLRDLAEIDRLVTDRRRDGAVGGGAQGREPGLGESQDSDIANAFGALAQPHRGRGDVPRSGTRTQHDIAFLGVAARDAVRVVRTTQC